MNIKLIDLNTQYLEIQEEVEASVLAVMRSTNYIMGQEVQKFEQNMQEYLGVKHAISVANGTDALVIALAALGIKEGDEIITTPFTFFATAESIKRIGAIPVFVDVDKKTFNINPGLIEEKITEKTKAILPVHIFGNPCDMCAINTIAKKHNLFVIEDACQAIGAKYKGEQIGTLSDVSCFSFFPTKNLGGMGDGGLIATNDDNVAHIVKALKNHGSGMAGREALQLLNPEFQDDFEIKKGFEKYYNYLIGYNSRLDEMQAAILNVKLKYIDLWNEKRRILASKYEENFGTQYTYQECTKDSETVYHMYSVLSENREKEIEKLKNAGIASGTYYPVPLHLQKVFLDLQYKVGDCPVAEEICEKVFAIPVYPELSEQEQEKVIKALKC
jgi:Predicted pyridoxal phosphate-dependent enzyme apparently involved in regulation of cell wall biogenesis